MQDAPPLIPPFDFTRHVLGPWSSPEMAISSAWTVTMGLLVAIACGLLGCYLILQGMALIGDAISHTVLLGIVLAFLVTGQLTGIAIFVGAAIVGTLTTVLIKFIHQSSRIKPDAAIGIVFTSLFALGVVLITTTRAGYAHIDTAHVLYGNLEFTLLKTTSVLGVEIPVVVLQMGLVTIVLVALITAFYKELLTVAFDPQLASAFGMRPAVFHYGMMAMLSLAVVGSFTAVGAILVVAMMIAPPATAYLLTDRLPRMFLLTVLLGASSSLVGYHAALWLDVSTGGMIVCVACSLFGLALLLSPKQGILATAYRRHRLRRTIAGGSTISNPAL